jgi:hypothetical protein
MVFVAGDSAELLIRIMAFLNSGTAAAAIESMVAFGSYEVGTIARLPAMDPGPAVENPATKILDARRAEAERQETNHLFVSPWAGSPSNRSNLVKCSQQIDELVSEAVGNEGPVVPLSSTYPTKWFAEDFESVPEPGIHEEISYLVGLAFGRWNVRYATGEVEPPPIPGPFEPLPRFSRGMLLGGGGYPVMTAPHDYPLRLPSDGLLHDDLGHPADILAALERAAVVLNQSAKPLLKSEIQTLRGHLRDRFFAAHLSQYSASRRYGPIYWQLTVPSKRWGLWLYAPALSREILFATARAAHEKLALLNDTITQVRNRATGDTDRESRQRAESLEELVAEIEKFAAIADGVAQSGWEPDLNDGLVLNAAPLEALFIDRTWRTQISTHRKALQEGKYSWATVQNQFYGRRQ